MVYLFRPTKNNTLLYDVKNTSLNVMCSKRNIITTLNFWLVFLKECWAKIITAVWGRSPQRKNSTFWIYWSGKSYMNVLELNRVMSLTESIYMWWIEKFSLIRGGFLFTPFFKMKIFPLIRGAVYLPGGFYYSMRCRR